MKNIITAGEISAKLIVILEIVRLINTLGKLLKLVNWLRSAKNYSTITKLIREAYRKQNLSIFFKCFPNLVSLNVFEFS